MSIATASLTIVGSISDAPGFGPSRLTKMGQGDVILAGANTYKGVTEIVEGVLKVQNARALGDASGNTIVNTGATVDNHAAIGDHVHIAPGVHLGGQVRIGEGALVGIGAVVLPGVTIGAWSVVGAGAVVTADVPPGATVVGVPARPLAVSAPR